jgi:hypothetical protein
MVGVFFRKYSIATFAASYCIAFLQGSHEVTSSDVTQIIQLDPVLNDKNNESSCLENKNLCIIRPYLLPPNHFLKPSLDAIFSSSRAILDDAAFAQAGFETIFNQPRSFIRVARHPDLPNHLIKANLDVDLKLKGGHTSWEWFLRRCEAAKVIRKIILEKNLRHFSVPEKYLYILPAEPKPPNSPTYSRKFLVLVVEDMHLVSDETNLHLWETMITQEHLDELFKILKKLPHMTLRASNMVFTKEGKIAFIDTEYIHRCSHGYERLDEFLNPKMRSYWQSITKRK